MSLMCPAAMDQMLRGGCGSTSATLVLPRYKQAIACMNCSPALVQARQQLKEMVWIKSSENMVLEAMYRLAGLHEALEDLLRVQPPQDTASINNKDKAPASPTGAVLPGSPASASGSTGHGSGRVLAQAAMFEAGPSNPDAAGVHLSGPHCCACHSFSWPKGCLSSVPHPQALLPPPIIGKRFESLSLRCLHAHKMLWVHPSTHVVHVYVLGLFKPPAVQLCCMQS